ncbi:MAG TPA: sulfurtransferase TusA family protein [Candidatus Limnocylindrales bacterium]|nr:sulfurtransferase TusA family protein [Candidatus Limnocylindrales bacterium]
MAHPAPVLEVAAIVDARGLSCPMPIVKTALAVKGVPSGSLIEVLATDPGSTKDFTAWCRSTGHDLVEDSFTPETRVYRYLIRRK